MVEAVLGSPTRRCFEQPRQPVYSLVSKRSSFAKWWSRIKHPSSLLPGHSPRLAGRRESGVAGAGRWVCWTIMIVINPFPPLSLVEAGLVGRRSRGTAARAAHKTTATWKVQMLWLSSLSITLCPSRAAAAPRATARRVVFSACPGPETGFSWATLWSGPMPRFGTSRTPP